MGAVGRSVVITLGEGNVIGAGPVGGVDDGKGMRLSLGDDVPQPTHEVALIAVGRSLGGLEADECRLVHAIAVLGHAAARTGHIGSEHGNLVVSIAFATPPPVHVEVASVVVYLVTIDDIGMSATGGYTDIDQGTPFAQLTVEQLVPAAGGVFVGIHRMDLGIDAEAID